MNKEKINYIFGLQYSDGLIDSYRLSGMEVFSGTLKQALNTVKYIREKENNPNWQVYGLVEINLE